MDRNARRILRRKQQVALARLQDKDVPEAVPAEEVDIERDASDDVDITVEPCWIFLLSLWLQF